MKQNKNICKGDVKLRHECIYIYIPYVKHKRISAYFRVALETCSAKIHTQFVIWWFKLCCVYWFDCKCPKYFDCFLTIVPVGKEILGTICILWGAKHVHSYKHSTRSRGLSKLIFIVIQITCVDRNCHCIRLLTWVLHEFLSKCFCHKVYTLNCLWLWVIRDRVDVLFS